MVKSFIIRRTGSLLVMTTEYRLLDSGNLKKLEQVGPYRLIRPALSAFWQPALPSNEWQQAAGTFQRNSSGGGKWTWHQSVPERWTVKFGGFDLEVKPTNFGHLGFFAEQYQNWDWIRQKVKDFTASGIADVQVLNLFAYSGVGSMAAAEAGAGVCHLDAAKGMIEWGRGNQQMNAQVPDKIRWIVDDVKKFTARELRRNRRYHGIVLDPPSFGRGAKGEVWKIEEDLQGLLKNCRDLMVSGELGFMILSCHSPGFSPMVLERLLKDLHGGQGTTECGEMTIPESASSRLLSAGCYARISLT
jgi:23S rRNA (cytosine1962-C5)-methyltransferase